MGRLILDTTVLVAVVRGRIDLEAIAAITDEVALPALVVAEFLTGVVRERDPARRAAQQEFFDQVLAVTPVVDYTTEIAIHHAVLLAHTQSTGTPRGAHDLIIAATARATGRTLLTTDAKARFDDLPEVDVRLVTV